MCMMTAGIKRFAACFVALCAAAVLMLTLNACAPKELNVAIIDGEETIEVTVQEGKTVSDALSAADITLNEGDEISPALDTKIENEGQEIIIERIKNVVIAVDGEDIDIQLLGGTVQDALDEAEVVLASGDKVDIDVATPIEEGMLITVTRAPKEQPKASSNAASTSKPAGKTLVSSTKVPNCADGSHGYIEKHWSDGTTTYEEY